MGAPSLSPISGIAACWTWWSRTNGPLLLYRNTVAPDNHWIEFDLEGARATAAPSGRRCESSGTASSNRRKFPAAVDSAAERSPAALRFGQSRAASTGGNSLAFGQDADPPPRPNECHKIVEPHEEGTHHCRYPCPQVTRSGASSASRIVSPAAVHHTDPAGGPGFVRPAGELLADPAGHRHRHVAGARLRRWF